MAKPLLYVLMVTNVKLNVKEVYMVSEKKLNGLPYILPFQFFFGFSDNLGHKLVDKAIKMLSPSPTINVVHDNTSCGCWTKNTHENSTLILGEGGGMLQSTNILSKIV